MKKMTTYKWDSTSLPDIGRNKKHNRDDFLKWSSVPIRAPYALYPSLNDMKRMSSPPNLALKPPGSPRPTRTETGSGKVPATPCHVTEGKGPEPQPHPEPQGPAESTEEPQRPNSVPLQTPEPPTSRYFSRKSNRYSEAGSTCSSPKHHHRAGQELCYLCMQRSMRNVPVSFEEERRRKELEQDALLQQYQQMKDQEAILVEQANQNGIRQSNQKVAAFNLGVAECLRDVKGKRSTDFVKSYVFQNRPLTPLRFYKQEEYSKALEGQVKLRKSRDRSEKHDREFQERLEQVQLAEDLASQREHYLKAKADQISQYQRALSAQIKRKPLPLPKAESDSKEPIFGRFDSTNEKLLEQRERAKALLRSQLDMVSEKKKSSILQHLTKQKEESEMLDRTKKELVEDRIGTHKRSYEMRRSLEQNWQSHHFDKLKTEHEERLRMRTPGMLLLQQTEKYKRCGQCERRTANCGESNIWSESRYIPGSRLMV
uniref:Coiled-coil domain-containing protein 81 n=1 Tax=Phallusia mammillata TaxID=59560 RepID=A0A6F9D977_9ASCI|nr:coiled-coil domain-containing protein 81 [Phallusia mammillata]